MKAGSQRPWPEAPAGRWWCLLLALTAAGVLAWLTGCTNDPFDPESLTNIPPVARIFVTGDSLNATSYYKRTFHWSGSDEDGFVVEYHVSIQTERGVPAPWDTTTRTDTTITFLTDDFGHAEATILLACRDDRGALSDTVSQFIPLRNFPPVINFQADYDTVRWSYGAANFRFFALDLDGNETMAGTFLYKLDTADTNIVQDWGTPAADPALGWVRKHFNDNQSRSFSVDLTGVRPAAQRTLTVAVIDEARAETRFDWSWNVREARGPVLLVADATPSIDAAYYAMMDSLLGAGQWSVFEILYGMPDRLWVLTETFRQFPAVFWYTGGSPSIRLKTATGVLREYLNPSDPSVPPGRLLLISKSATGVSSNLPRAFIIEVLGLNPLARPVQSFMIPTGQHALALRPGLPDLTAASVNASGLGLQVGTSAEAIYQMEYCESCYPRPGPYDPYVAARRPRAATDPLARVVTFTMQLEYFDRAEAVAALQTLLSQELGVVLP
jgi:hypothetical protein